MKQKGGWGVGFQSNAGVRRYGGLGLRIKICAHCFFRFSLHSTYSFKTRISYSTSWEEFHICTPNKQVPHLVRNRAPQV